MNHRSTPRLRAALDTRIAVRAVLTSVRSGSSVLVALSGGADSLALAAATAYEAGTAGISGGAVIVDHGLQSGSDTVAERAAEQAKDLGLSPVFVRRVEVARDRGGIEAGAREARYEALVAAAAETRAAAILTAHTRDDQAEQVLLGLARGSGLRSLAGIPSERVIDGTRILRPFLDEHAGVTRETTERACAELSLEPWRDPHNSDTVYARVKVRQRILPLIEDQLGPGISEALARTADLAREDAEALDAFAAEALESAILHEAGDVSGEVRASIDALSSFLPAIRNRAIRHLTLTRFGVHLTRDRTLAIANLVTDWHGQGPIDAPGVMVMRVGNALVFAHS